MSATLIDFDPRDPFKLPEDVTWPIERVGNVERHGARLRVALIAEGHPRKFKQFPLDRAADAEIFVAAFREEAGQRVRSVAEAVTEYVGELRTVGNVPRNEPGRRRRARKPVKSWKHRRSMLEGILQLVDPELRAKNRGRRRPVELPFRDRAMKDLTEREAQRLYDARVKAGLAADSHQSELTYARSFGDWCVWKGYMKANPFANVMPQGQLSAGKDQLRKDEIQKFLDVAAEDPHPLAGFAASVCLLLELRSTELLGRCVRDLDSNGTELVLPHNKVKSKHSVRCLEIPVQLQPKFRALAEAAFKGLLVPGESGPGARLVPMHSNTLLKHVKRLCRKAGVPEVVVHGLRGTGITKKVAEGASVESVSAEAGHGTLQVTRDYYLTPGVEQSANARRKADHFLGNATPTPPATDSLSLGTKPRPEFPVVRRLSLVP